MKPLSTGSTPVLGAAPTLRLAAFLPYRLNVAAAAVSEGLARIYSDRFGIGIPEWRVLATVGEFRSITAKAVGRHARMGKVKVSRAASVLEARGMISRNVNEVDMRETFLVLTPEGEGVYDEVAPLALAYADRLLATLSERDKRKLESLLERITHAAESGLEVD